jgi:hypothetical protein
MTATSPVERLVGVLRLDYEERLTLEIALNAFKDTHGRAPRDWTELLLWAPQVGF